MTIDTVFHDLSNETKAARISDNRGASNTYVLTHKARILTDRLSLHIRGNIMGKVAYSTHIMQHYVIIDGRGSGIIAQAAVY